MSIIIKPLSLLIFIIFFTNFYFFFKKNPFEYSNYIVSLNIINIVILFYYLTIYKKYDVYYTYVSIGLVSAFLAYVL
jgi:hypothetical protein